MKLPNTPNVTRRSFVASVGAATVLPPAAAVLADSAEAAPPPAAHHRATAPAEPQQSVYLFFNVAEARFIEAACERLIPADESGAGALAAGVPNYLDKQLGGAWGAGERLYRSGPWLPGTPSQGYQLPFTPAELFHTALRAINQEFEKRGTAFGDLSAQAQDAYLKSLEAGGQDLDGVPSAVFFDMLLRMTVEGFFSDPVYGGNRDMVAWRMIGFPGAYADYYEAIDQHGVKFERAPMSIGEDRHGHVHVQPEIPAALYPVPAGTPAWGKGWKEAVLKHYNHTVMFSLHGSSVSQRQNYLDLDPTYRDAWGQPLLRMTFDFPPNDLKMAAYVTAKAVEIGKAMGARLVNGSPRKGPYTTQQYQTTHNTGGTVMGNDPNTSVVNRYLQCWDVPNVFVIGASNYPQNASWNPTGTLGALTYWAADALKNKYLKNPGQLVSA